MIEEPKPQFGGHEKRVAPQMDFFFYDYILHRFSPSTVLHFVLLSGVLAETGSYMYFWFVVRLYWVFAGYYTTMYESRHDLVKDDHILYARTVLTPNREIMIASRTSLASPLGVSANRAGTSAFWRGPFTPAVRPEMETFDFICTLQVVAHLLTYDNMYRKCSNLLRSLNHSINLKHIMNFKTWIAH